MENRYQKWVNLSFLAVAVLAGYLISALSFKVSGTYDLEARFNQIELAIRILSIVVGGLLFSILYKNEKSNQFMNEVVAELTRVTWPAQKDTASATAIVVIMVLISGLTLGFLDYIWTQLLKWIL